MTMAVGVGRLDQLVDFVGRQMLSGAQLGIWWPLRGNCSIFSGWRYEARFDFATV
jgi:hypothetical protein